MARRVAWVAVGLMGLSTVLATGVARAEDLPWQAGAAKVDITPSGPVWLAGYAARKAPSEGVLHPIYARALAIRDAHGHTAVLLALDLVGVKAALSDRIRQAVAKQHAIEPGAIAVISSHTHGAPIPMDTPDRFNAYGISLEQSQPNVAWTAELERKAVEAATNAIAALRPAQLDHGVGKADFAMNRREPTATGFRIGVNPAGPTDKRVPVLRVRGTDGRLLAVAFGYACHCTTLGADMMKVHGDYAGHAQAALEAAHPGAVALFLTGCGGDQNPNPRGQPAQAEQYGRELAEAVGKVLDGQLNALSGDLRVATASPTVRFAGPTDRASYEKRRDEPNANRKSHARRMLDRLDRGEPIESEHAYPIQAFALGDRLTLLTLAGEVVVDYALRLEKELGGPDHPLWVVAYANDVFGYIPSRRVLEEGGYEGLEAFYYSPYPTPLASEVEETIVGEAGRLVRAVRVAPSPVGSP